jgi:hypothetical protein
VAERQSPHEVVEALFSHVVAVEGPRPNVLPPQWHMCAAALAALHAVGVISDEEAGVWRERLESEAKRLMESERVHQMLEGLQPGPQSWSDAEAQQAALEFLATSIELTSHHREALRQSGVSAGSTDLLSRGYGAVEALHSVGLIDDRERREWGKRFAEVAAATMPEGTRTITAPSQVRGRMARATRAPTPTNGEPALPRIDGVEAAQPFSGRGLREVLLIRSDASDEAPRLQLVELHEDAVVIDWIQPARREPHVPSVYPRLVVRDDVGTQYTPRGGSGGSFGEMLRYRQAFVPAIPPRAVTLEVQLDAVQWRVSLRDGDEEPG